MLGWALAGSVFGQDPEPGELLWEFDPGNAASNQDFFTEPAIGPDGTIYVGHVPSASAGSGVFYAINPDGTERWKKTFSFPSYERFGGGQSSSFQAATIGLDGTIYLACGGSQYAYTPDGTLKWKKSYGVSDPREQTAYLAPLAISNSGRVYLPQGNNALIELDSTNGDSLWEFKSTDEHRFSFSRSAALTFEGDVLFTAWDNHLYRLDPDGTMRFRYNSGGKDYPSGGSPPSISSSGRVSGPQGDLYETYYLAVRSPQSGSFPTFLNAYPGVSVTPLIDHDQSLLFADRHGNLIKVNANLQERWSLSGYADQSPILCEDGTIFAISNDHKNPTIRNLDTNGQTVFEIEGQMPDPGASAPSYPQEHDVVQPLARLALSRSGELYAAARNGKIYAFKAPGGLSTSDWPKNYGGYENASRVTMSLPEIVSGPESVAVVSGSPVTLSVAVIGRPLPTVQWYREGEIIPGALGSTLRVGTLGHEEEGDYYVVVQNELGSIKSELATVTVSHRLTVNSTGLGATSVDPLEPLYEHLAPVVVSATPATGFVFEAWSGSSASTENPLSIAMDYSKSLTAQFKDIEAPALVLNETFPAVTDVPEFTVTGSIGDNDGISSVSFVLNEAFPTGVPVLDSQFSLSLPLQFGENTLQLIVRDRSGLETISDQVIVWEPGHSWTLEGPESLGEAKILSTEIYLGSPGDVAGANISVTSDPALLTYQKFEPAEAISRTFQTLSEENGVMSLTFASLGKTIPAGKTLIGTLFYRVRSLPQPIEHVFTLQQSDLAGIDGSPIEESSGIRNASVLLQPRGIIGDVNNNGRFDVGDAQRLQRLLGGLDEFRPWDSALNDANESGSLDIGDIIVVLQTAVGLLSQPGVAQRRGHSQPVPVAFDPDAPRARIVFDPPFAQPGATVIARVVLDSIPSEFGGAEFTLRYPVDALRLIDEDSHQVGNIQPDSSLYLWNVGPSQNDYANQDGTISFAAGSAENWAGSEAGGVIAEFEFTVQEGAASQAIWELDLQESDVSFDDGLTVLKCHTEPAQFIGQPLTWISWLSTVFTPDERGDPQISGRFADADQDGHSNEFEYFLGTDPRLADGEDAVQATWVETEDGQVFFGLEVAYDVRVTDLMPAMEWSQDLLSWSADDAGGSPDWWTRVYPIGAEKSDAGKLILMDLRTPSAVAPAFLRLKLE